MSSSARRPWNNWAPNTADNEKWEKWKKIFYPRYEKLGGETRIWWGAVRMRRDKLRWFSTLNWRIYVLHEIVGIFIIIIWSVLYLANDFSFLDFLVIRTLFNLRPGAVFDTRDVFMSYIVPVSKSSTIQFLSTSSCAAPSRTIFCGRRDKKLENIRFVCLFTLPEVYLSWLRDSIRKNSTEVQRSLTMAR